MLTLCTKLSVVRKSYQFNRRATAIESWNVLRQLRSWVRESNKQNYQFVVVIFKSNTQQNTQPLHTWKSWSNDSLSRSNVCAIPDNCQHLRQWTCTCEKDWREMANMSVHDCNVHCSVRQATSTTHIALTLACMQIANRSISRIYIGSPTRCCGWWWWYSELQSDRPWGELASPSFVSSVKVFFSFLGNITKLLFNLRRVESVFSS